MDPDLKLIWTFSQSKWLNLDQKINDQYNLIKKNNFFKDFLEKFFMYIKYVQVRSFLLHM